VTALLESAAYRASYTQEDAEYPGGMGPNHLIQDCIPILRIAPPTKKSEFPHFVDKRQNLRDSTSNQHFHRLRLLCERRKRHGVEERNGCGGRAY